MIPRERVLTAMQLQHPDRVPLMCQFSFGFMIQQLKGKGISPMEFWLDAHKYVEGLLILRNRYNFDGILVSVHGHFENWESRIEILETVNGAKVATYPDRRETYSDDDLPSAEFLIKIIRTLEPWMSIVFLMK